MTTNKAVAEQAQVGPADSSPAAAGSIVPKVLAEVIGTFWLVFAGCGSVAFLGELRGPVDLLAVSLAFGLSVVTMAYAVGHVSGCHLNPAVSVGLWMGGRFPARELPAYIGAQIGGGLLGALAIVLIMNGDATSVAQGVSNGFGDHSPGKFSLVSAIVAELVLTFIFLTVILGATAKRAPAGFAGLAIGLCLALIHIVGIPVTGVSVNPARSLGPALVGRGWALEQVWVFLLVPTIGGALAGYASRFLSHDS